jgi:3-hydroxybutyryl-CoA dehydrogenase
VTQIHRVGVVGLGIMGAGIAEVCARAGLDVLAADGTQGAARAGRERVIRSLRRAVAAGKLTAAAGEAALRSIRFTTDLAEFADRDLVIEAITEDEGAKSALLAALDTILTVPQAILATNTSSIPIMKLAVAAGRSSQFIGIHFFNPAPVLSLVEMIPCLLTSEDTCQRTEAFVTALGKTAIRCPDRAGFMVNALLIPYLLAAIRMSESGFASAADIDSGMVLGCGHPMGPLRLADLIGLDTVLAIATSMHREYAEPRYAPPPLLRRMVDAGLLGRKTGRGFHDYTGPSETKAGRSHPKKGVEGSEHDQRHASHLSTR